jgi:hypothetical protein
MTSRPSITPRESSAAVWAPWLAAPLFALLPIGGCGLADGLRPTATTDQSATDEAPGPAAPVVRVVTPDVRQVAFGPTAH